MRKVILVSVFSTIMCCVSFGATLQRTILSHQGTLTQYDANHWQQAIEDAVDGDTVYFSSGYFEGDIVITKRITLIGAGVSEQDTFYKDSQKDVYEDTGVYDGSGTSGQSTTVNGNITIEVTGTLSSTMFEGFCFYTLDFLDSRVKRGSITVKGAVWGLSIKRCQIGDYFKSEAKVTNLILEDCYIGNMFCANLDNPDIHNCYFESFHGDGVENLELLNCAGPIIELDNCNLINCIIWGYPWEYTNTYLNCVYERGNSKTTYSNCWIESNPNALTKSQLESKGYLGTDNTVVGPLGGPAPFTLIPSQPYVSSSTLTYNKSTKKLNVNVTVKQGK